MYYILEQSISIQRAIKYLNKQKHKCLIFVDNKKIDWNTNRRRY